MFRMWGKEWKDNRMVRDTVICNETQNSRTKKVLQSLEGICYEFDLQTPIWLNGNVQEFQRLSKTRFYQDNFIEHIDFEYLEIQIIEE